MYIMINGEWVINSLTPWVSPSGHHSICSLISHSPAQIIRSPLIRSPHLTRRQMRCDVVDYMRLHIKQYLW